MKRFLALILSLLLILCCGCAPASPQQQEQSANEKIAVYFIDVGQADCALVTLNGKNMLIDGGNVEDGPDVVSFIKKLGITTLDYVIATHAHEDHAGGLGTIINNFTVKNVYSPVSTYSSTCFKEFVEAADKQCGVTLCKQGMSFDLGGASAKVLWPIKPAEEDTNNTSIVLKLTYGDISFLFTGDLEHDAETRLVETGADLRADVLKVGHHGSDTSSSYLFLRSVLPQIGIISCGKDNSYGHPHDVILERYEQAEVKLLRTDEVGTVKISSDGTTISVAYGDFNQNYEKTEATPALDTYYIGNKSSKKFHLPSCNKIPSAENSIKLKDRDDAVGRGYTPCGICKP